MQKKQVIESAIQDFVFNSTFADGRRTSFKLAKKIGVSKSEILLMRQKNIKRRQLREDNLERMTYPDRASFLKIVKECEFNLDAKSSRYNCTGVDWKAFHRPSSCGGWVLIAPDEPGNNWHITDPILVRYLSNKFLKS